ncbi:hypothetical protein SSBR45G_32180 [Bradyrhizobium sp. SSBR45G]|uniref:hypothetical protein n=1 Tax=unclassified Bradyrhizobium TaxID=2631580 RepID=UPI002342BC75|nr:MULTISPECIES: hypothetical protein [unclassified Bradyrhizobium]GLH78309.1 hypothetical protein SSBR45G_32180 [Bradyrhizobium sp. SSBR45G]GLH86092.1 hypothetical protein SSBR45R_35520 [Bradyrhizobium sp. SSBR45R]
MPLIDHFLPDYQFSERHETRVRCPPGALLDLIQTWEPRDRFSDAAMTVRQTPARLMHRLAPSRHPAPQPFSLKSFAPLGRDGDRAMVGGLIGQFWRNDFGLVPIASPEAFVAFDAPRTPKLVLGFMAEPEGEMTRLVTETRVYCPDRMSYVMFLPYWLLIRPASGLIRRRMLTAIRETAERRSTDRGMAAQQD